MNMVRGSRKAKVLSAAAAALTLVGVAGLAVGQNQPAKELPTKDVPTKEVPAKQLPASMTPQLKGQETGNAARPAGRAIEPLDPSAVLAFEHMEFDWGRIDDSHKVNHELLFRNVSDRPVRVTRVQASCGCTAGRPSKQVYEPGEQGSIRVEFDPKGRKGRQEKTVTVETDHPDAPRVLLRVTSHVVPQVSIEPNKIYFPTTQRGTSATSTFRVLGRSEGFEVTKIETGPEFVNARVVGSEQVVEDGEPYTQVNIEVDLLPGAPVGRFQSALTVYTNHPGAESHTVAIGGDIQGQLRSIPERMQLRVSTPNTPFDAQVRLDSRTGESFEILSVDYETAAELNLVVDLERVEMGGRESYVLRINGVTPPRNGPISGSVIIKSTLDNGEAVTIPFYGSVYNRPTRASAQ